MIEFGYGVLIRGSVQMLVLLYVHQKRENFSPSLFFTLLQGSFVTYPHCFGTAFTSNVTSQLNSREREGASDSKNPDPYYCLIWSYGFYFLGRPVLI